VSGLFVKLK